MGLRSSWKKLKKSVSTAYRKVDTAAGGYLPGGVTVKEVKASNASKTTSSNTQRTAESKSSSTINPTASRNSGSSGGSSGSGRNTVRDVIENINTKIENTKVGQAINKVGSRIANTTANVITTGTEVFNKVVNKPTPTSTVTPTKPEVIDVAKIRTDERNRIRNEQNAAAYNQYDYGESKEFTVKGNTVKVGNTTYEGNAPIPELGGRTAIDFAREYNRSAKIQDVDVNNGIVVTMGRPSKAEEEKAIAEQVKAQQEQYVEKVKAQQEVVIPVMNQDLTRFEKAYKGVSNFFKDVKEKVRSVNVAGIFPGVAPRNLGKDKVYIPLGIAADVAAPKVVEGVSYIKNKVNPAFKLAGSSRQFTIAEFGEGRKSLDPNKSFVENVKDFKIKPQFTKVSDLKEESKQDRNTLTQDLTRKDLEARNIIQTYQPVYEEIKSQEFLKSEYGKSAYMGEMSFEDAAAEFEKSDKAKEINLQYQQQIEDAYKGKPSFTSFKIFGLNTVGAISSLVPETRVGFALTAGAVVGGVKLASAVPQSVWTGVEVGYGVQGLFKAYNPDLSPPERAGGFVEAGLAASLLTAQGIRYARQGVWEYKNVPAGKGKYKTYNIGTEGKYVYTANGKKLETVTFRNQRFAQIPTEGRRTVVNTRWRNWLGLDPIYQGVPGVGRTTATTYTGLRGTRTVTSTVNPRQTAFDILTKRNRLSTSSANKILRFQAPTIKYINLKSGVIFTTTGSEGATAKGVLDFRIAQPRILVDKKLGIYTRGATTKAQTYFVDRTLTFEKGKPIVKSSLIRADSYVSSKGYLYNTLGQQNKNTAFLYKQTDKVVATKNIESFRDISNIEGVKVYSPYKYQDLFSSYERQQLIPVKKFIIQDGLIKATYKSPVKGAIRTTILKQPSQVEISFKGLEETGSKVNIVRGTTKLGSVSKSKAIDLFKESLSKVVPKGTPTITGASLVDDVVKDVTRGSRYAGLGMYERTSEGAGALSIMQQQANINLLQQSNINLLKTSIMPSITTTVPRTAIGVTSASSLLLPAEGTLLTGLSLVGTDNRIDTDLGISFQPASRTDIRLNEGITTAQLVSQATTTSTLSTPITPPPITPPDTKVVVEPIAPQTPIFALTSNVLEDRKKKPEKKTKDLFEVYVKKSGKDIKLGKYSSLVEAKSKLVRNLRDTLRASGFITKNKEKLKAQSLGLFGGEFRPSKTNKYSIVEKKNRRLKKGTGEISEILSIRKGNKKTTSLLGTTKKRSKKKSKSKNMFGL